MQGTDGVMPGGVRAFISGLENSGFKDRIKSRRQFPSKDPVYAELSPGCLLKAAEDVLPVIGAGKLYSHQVEAMEMAGEGRNILVTTPTSSGKTLIYNMIVLNAAAKNPRSRALYVFPAKSLARDQFKTFEDLAGRFRLPPASPGQAGAAIYDGDTPSAERFKIRRSPPGVLFTNPDMLHSGILAYHGLWAEYFRNLCFVMLDEIHAYRGIFGCHVSAVIRRLRRICSFYGSSPLFISSSATMANGEEFARRLTGLDFSLITESGAPRGEKHYLFWDPGDGSPYTEAVRLLKLALEKGLKTIVFTRSRKTTELIYRMYIEGDPAAAGRISAYRAGYLPGERREIEKKLFSDNLDAVIATSALELGIDVGGIDCCMLVGYPGSMISAFQRAGRAGRSGKSSVIIFLPMADSLDRYFLKHPDKYFSGSFESVIIDEENRHILREQLPCAADELPLVPEDAKYFRMLESTAREFAAEGIVLAGKDGRSWHAPGKYPHRGVSIRSCGENFTIINAADNSVIGDISSARVFHECHPGALYSHRGEEYEVVDLGLQARNVYARKTSADYYTQPGSSETVDINRTLKSRKTGRFTAGLGGVRVESRVVSYEKRRSPGGELLGEYRLNLPPQCFETVALWLELPPEYRMRAATAGGIHAAEHALIGLLPLFTLCDPWDAGGASSLFHPQCEGPVIFVYDGYPGGVGLAEKAYERIDELIQAAAELITECECEQGCPACVQSPKCGSRNEPLDKECAVDILRGGGEDVPHDEIRLNREPGAPEGSRVPGAPAGKKIMFFDLETRRSADEVGGWENKREMLVSVAVAFDESSGDYRVFTEEDIGVLIDELFRADLVVGFNIKGFDMEVLSAYTNRDLSGVRMLDILEEIRRVLGRRISLSDIAGETLGEPKTGSGLDALRWFREGEMKKLIGYCRKDVELTRRIYAFGREKGFLLFRHSRLGVMRIPVEWGKE